MPWPIWAWCHARRAIWRRRRSVFARRSPSIPATYLPSITWRLRKDQGDLEEAEKYFRQALALQPRHAGAHYNLGNILVERGQTAEASSCFRNAVSLNPDHADAHSNLGSLLMEQGQLAEAADCYRAALRSKPDDASAYSNLGVIFKDQGQVDDALVCYRNALHLDPNYVDALSNLGNLLKDLRRLTEAIDCYRQALRIDPNHVTSLYNLGIALKEQGNIEEALACCHTALKLDALHARSHHHLGDILRDEGKLAEAVLSYRESIRIDPRYADAHNNLGSALFKQGFYDDGTAAYEKAMELEPGHAVARFNRAIIWLLLGNLAKGWPDYEFRFKEPGTTPRVFAEPRWDGGPLAGKTILLYAEQGLGDTLHFIRYAAALKKMSAGQAPVTVIFETQPSLLAVLQNVAGVDVLVPRGQPLPRFDVQAPLMSLPGIMQTTFTDIPGEFPYVYARPRLVEHWRQELAKIPGPEALKPFTVGIVWQGSLTHKDDRFRSFSLKHFEKLARVPGVRLVSLQKGPGCEQLAALPFPVVDLGDRLDAEAPFIDTAALLTILDLVITVDSAVAHLAGALGVRTWVALSLVPDWRWLLDRSDSPWYPSLRLFRQTRLGAWDEVFDRMASELTNLVSSDR